MAARLPGLLDGKLEAGEIDIDPSIIDVEALRAGRIKRFTPEQIAAIDAVPLTSRVPSEIEMRLAENGLDLLEHHPERRTLALALLRARLAAFKAIDERNLGEPIETPPRPAPFAVIESDDKPRAPKLSAMRERWLRTFVRTTNRPPTIRSICAIFST